jgi:catechol 2,3-dioxygenase-like lactoylglutathione lyase family enzyme
MGDYAAPTLPSRDLAATEAFYTRLGFMTNVKADNWMILSRGALTAEFFPMPQINVNESWFGACFHVDDLDALHAAFSNAGIPSTGVPRLTEPYRAPFGLRKFEMIDEDGNLIHCLENKHG